MRVASFNILHGRSPADRRVDLDRFAAAVGSLDADVLALQEVDRGLPRSHGADLAAIAAEALGAVWHRFVPTIPGRPDAGGAPTGYGIALVSRHPVRAWRALRLPRAALPKPVVRAGRIHMVSDEPRAAIVATVATPGRDVTVAGTHLSFLAPWSHWQLPALLRALRPVTGPVVVTGDLNLVRPLSLGVFGFRPLVERPTFPAWAPRRQLDHVLGRDVGEPEAAGVERLPVSDHRAVWVDLAV